MFEQMKPITVTNLQFRRPNTEDGGSMWKLVKESGVLDVNSSYSYLMLCKYFHDTCLLAEDRDAEQLAGFVTGFRLPNEADTYFVWQIAVSDSCRGQGIATRLIKQVLERLQGIRYVAATIAPSNAASQSLFRKLARDWNAPLSVEPSAGFCAGQFPEGSHEDEHLYKIGPLAEKANSDHTAY